jgi:hypothetical protein
VRSLTALLCVLLARGGALAQEAAPEPQAPAAPATAAPTPEQAAPPTHPEEVSRPPAPAESPSLDFNLLPESPAVPVDPAMESRIHTRRTMLEIHQALGIATVVLLTTAVVFGQLNYDDRFGGGPNLGTYSLWHSGFAAAGTITFAASGLLALLAPVPLEKRSELDTITVHKWSMLVATAGFVAEIVLGIYAASREGYVDQASFAQAHLVIGYVTAGAVGVGTAALFF